MLKKLGLLQWLFADHTHQLQPPAFDQEAIVMEVIQPKRQWRVSFSGSYWKARCTQEAALQPGDIVYVVDRQNITLIVAPKLVSHC
ncbi:MAG: NfeD family protein [Lyngbya sp. HA4199-MV5]|jgi:membrane protein implicated in regulation of membrane protease activity|nr:NfeD family protein [Lyngbya sp. HA4199-MV5]